MNNINFNQDGGFRLSTNIMSAVQAAYSLFNSLGWIGGNFTIISGCVVNGTAVSDGVVFINGEVLPFKGGTASTNVIIRETVTNYPFQNGTVKPVHYERFVQFGTSTPETTFPWADFKRLFATKDIQAFKDNHNTRITNLEGKQAFAVGMIIRFDQPLTVPAPAGWIDWNPVDEQGRAWVARSESDSDFALGNKTGAKTHQLTAGQLPKQEGQFQTVSNSGGSGIVTKIGGSGSSIGGSSTPSFQHAEMKISFGNNEAHNNVQPSVAVRYIKYVGIQE